MSSFRRLISICTLSCAALLVACGGLEPDSVSPPGADDELQSRSQAINGTPIFGAGCTAAEQAIIGNAFMTVKIWLLWTSTLERCMQNSFLSMSREELYPQTEDSVERIMERMRENLPTHFECVSDPGWSWASYSPGSEKVTFNKDYLANHSQLHIAGVILHEVSHNKGYDHPVAPGSWVEYKYTVPDQLATCLSEIYSQPNLYNNNIDVKRDALRGEVELALVGAGGGGPYEMTCQNGAHVNAVYLGTGTFNGYNVVRRMTAFCYKTDGSYASQATVGGSVSAYHYKSCPSGYRATGIYGRAGLYVDSLGLLCTPLSTLQAKSSYTMVASGQAGGSGGIDFRRECPAGMAIAQIYGRSAAAIDQVRIVCQNVNEKRGSYSKSGVYGSAVGYAKYRRCSGYGALVGLYGQVNSATVNRLGGRCLETRQQGMLFSKYPVATSGTNHVTPANGVDRHSGVTPLQNDCPAGQLVVGLRVRSTGDAVSAIGARCADPSAWENSSNPTISNLALQGGTGGWLQSFSCPAGKFVVGLDSWFADDAGGEAVIKGVRAVCRTLVSPTVLILKQ